MNKMDFMWLLDEALDLIKQEDRELGDEQRITKVGVYEDIGFVRYVNKLKVKTPEGDEFEVFVIKTK